MPSGHKAFLVHNPADVDLLLMHNKTFAAEYVHEIYISSFEDGSEDHHANQWQDLTFSIIEKASGHCGKGETVGCEGHQS